MVARVGGTQYFDASVRHKEGNKPGTQFRTPILLSALGVGGTGSCVFPRLECCVLIGLDQICPGIPQTSSTSNTRELVRNAVCQPHPGSNSEIRIGTQKFSSDHTAGHV